MGTRSSWFFFKSRNTHFGHMSSLESTRPSQKMQVLFMEYQESSRRVSIVYCPRGSLEETGTFYFPWFNLVYPSVRAFNEGLPRPRGARAQGIARPLFFFPVPLVRKGVAKAALDCAHRTRAFLGRAFCEQGGHLAAPSSPFPPAGDSSPLIYVDR